MPTKTQKQLSSTVAFECDAAVLLKALKRAMTGVSTRGSIDILKGVLISTEKNVVKLSCTDMDRVVTAQIPRSKAGVGRMVVPAAKLRSILETLSGTVIIGSEGDQAFVQSGKFKAKLSLRDADDYPKLPERETFNFGLLTKDIQAAWPSVSKAYTQDESRPILTGVQLSREPGKVWLVATDSFQLGVDSFPIADDAAIDERHRDLIVRGDGLALVLSTAKALRAEEIHVLNFSQGVSSFAGFVLAPGSDEETTVWCRKIEGQFPNWRQLIPEGFAMEASLGREQAIVSIKRITKLLKHSPARFDLKVGKPLVVSAFEYDETELEDSIEATITGLGNLEIGFNPTLFLAGLESLEGAEVKLRVIDPLRPGLLTGERPDARYLVMPIRLK